MSLSLFNKQVLLCLIFLGSYPGIQRTVSGVFAEDELPHAFQLGQVEARFIQGVTGPGDKPYRGKQRKIDTDIGGK